MHVDLLSIPQSRFRWDRRLQIQNLFMAFKRVVVVFEENLNASRPSGHPPVSIVIVLSVRGEIMSKTLLSVS